MLSITTVRHSGHSTRYASVFNFQKLPPQVQPFVMLSAPSAVWSWHLRGPASTTCAAGRWKMDDGKTMMEHVFGPNGTFVKYNMEESTDPYETTNQQENSNEGINFQAPRDLLFAIPNSEITMSNGTIKQNEGYN